MRITAGMSCRSRSGAFDKPRQLVIACAAIALCAQAPFAGAEPAGPANAPLPPPITAIARPTLSGEIPLYRPTAKAKAEEQWEDLRGARLVRNVVTPTLTPVLPDPTKATGAAVIVAPGGAWLVLAMDTEGFDVARRLADRGIAAFVLKYRTAPTDRDPAKMIQQMSTVMGAIAQDRIAGTSNTKFEGVPQAVEDAGAVAVEDAGAAVRLVRSRASEWGVDAKRVGYLGFSAGATTGVHLALLPNAASRPDFLGSIYGVTDVGPVPDYAPPLFAATAMDDPLFDLSKGGLLPSWAKAKRPVEAHIYELGGHGFSSGTSGEMWFKQFYAWLKTRGELAPTR